MSNMVDQLAVTEMKMLITVCEALLWLQKLVNF